MLPFFLSRVLARRSRRDSKAVMPWIANPVSPVRLRIAPPNEKNLAATRGFFRCNGSVSTRPEVVPDIENARMQLHKQFGGVLWFEVGCVRLCCNSVLHGHDHVEAWLDAHQLRTKASEPRMRRLVVNHSQILIRTPREACRRLSHRCVGASGVRSTLVPGAGIEPAHLSVANFKSATSTNFVTRARSKR